MHLVINIFPYKKKVIYVAVTMPFQEIFLFLLVLVCMCFSFAINNLIAVGFSGQTWKTNHERLTFSGTILQCPTHATANYGR